MRKLTIESKNAEVYVSDYWAQIEGENIENLVRENLEKGTFRAKVTIIIEELENSGIQIKSNKPEETREEDENEDN